MKTSRLIVVLFGSATLLVAIIVLLAFQAIEQNEQAAVERKQSFVTSDAAGRMLSSIKDAETGQRGYLLTGDKAYLDPYLVALKEIKINLLALRALTRDDFVQQQRLDTLEPIIEENGFAD